MMNADKKRDLFHLLQNPAKAQHPPWLRRGPSRGILLLGFFAGMTFSWGEASSQSPGLPRQVQLMIDGKPYGCTPLDSAPPASEAGTYAPADLQRSAADRQYPAGAGIEPPGAQGTVTFQSRVDLSCLEKIAEKAGQIKSSGLLMEQAGRCRQRAALHPDCQPIHSSPQPECIDWIRQRVTGTTFLNDQAKIIAACQVIGYRCAGR